MSNPAIEIESLSKRFTIGHQLSGDLRNTISQRLRNIISNEKKSWETFWALKDISMRLNKGDVLGIIGKNGAGKSTLLKILSRITFPTSGRIEINGRVSSLLEVGTGFHQELSGRENIFLNGTILGMKRKEIKQKFDQIVDFSGVEKFIDTPVKHYSSGMKVRLAFSVAAHLEPEILIVDEVLAVGDIEFQKKCLGKMEQVSKSLGRTILFVSHNLGAVYNLCTRVIWLKEGKLEQEGQPKSVIASYTQSAAQENAQDLNKPIELGRWTILESFKLDNQVISPFQQLRYRFTLNSRVVNKVTDLALLIYNDQQKRVGIVDLRCEQLVNLTASKPVFTISGSIERPGLVEGSYSCGLYIGSTLTQGNFYDIGRFTITDRDRKITPYPIEHRGIVEFHNRFEII